MQLLHEFCCCPFWLCRPSLWLLLPGISPHSRLTSLSHAGDSCGPCNQLQLAVIKAAGACLALASSQCLDAACTCCPYLHLLACNWRAARALHRLCSLGASLIRDQLLVQEVPAAAS
jgi:hypothetical protein